MDLSTRYFRDPREEEEERRALEALAGADAPAAFHADLDLTEDPEALAGQPIGDEDLGGRTSPEPLAPPEPVGKREPALDSGRLDPFDAAAAAMAAEEEPQAQSGGGMDWGPLGGGVGFAALADLAINGGRGIPQVLALGAQAQQQRKANEYTQARQGRRDALEAEYKRAQIANMGTDAELTRGQQELTRSGQGLRQKEIDQQNAELELRRQRAAAAEQGNVDPATGKPYPRLSEDERRALDYQDRHADYAADNEFRNKQLEQQATLSREGMASRESLAARRGKGGKGGGRAAAGGGGTGAPDDELTAGQVRKIEQDRKGALETPIPGTEVVDAPAWQASVQTPAARGQVATLARGYRQVMEGIDRMVALREQHGTEMRDGQAKTDYNLAQKAVIGGFTQIGNSGVLNAGEFKRYAEDIPSMGLHLNDLWRLVPGGEDPTLGQLRGLKSASEASIDAALGTYGVRRARNSPAIDDNPIARKYGARRVQ
ncbi:MAG: hypothetical protein JXB36_02930 [Gammaproteobacteria bacterium]|nr:hypothetical protein [Gammaproteobacteria bacterium]